MFEVEEPRRGRGYGVLPACTLCALAVVIEPCFSSEANCVVGTEIVSFEVFVQRA